MTKNVSEQCLQLLAEAGARHVFGIPGDALNPFVRAVVRHPETSWIGVQHEENAAFAAYAQAELSDNLAVCAGSTGPGALHLINGLYNAAKERAPVIAVTGQVAVHQLGSDYFQEIDLQKAFDEVCAFQATIRSPDQAARVVKRAIHIALEKRAVCRIEIPAEIGATEAGGQAFLPQALPQPGLLTPHPAALDAAIAALEKANSITILAGVGCRGTADEVYRLSELLKAPIVHTVRSSDIFHHLQLNVVGISGLIGNPAAYQAIMNCELLLMLGTDFPYDEFLPANTVTVQVDTRLGNIGKRTGVTAGIHSNMEAVLPPLLERLTPKAEDAFLQKISERFDTWQEQGQKKTDLEHDHDCLHPQLYTRHLGEVAASDAIFALDTSTAVIWASRHITFHAQRRMLGAFNLGTLAVAMPAAIGAQLLHPSREVWALIGDGGFNMCMQEFLTACQQELPIKVLIFNNSEYNLVKLEMEQAGEEPALGPIRFSNPDYLAFARSLGGDGVRVEHVEDIPAAFEQAKNSSRPFLIDAVVTGGEIPIPPHMSVKQALKLTKSKIKETVKAAKGDHRQWENIKEQLQALLDYR